MKSPGSIEFFPSMEEVRERQDFFDQIAAQDHVRVLDLPPLPVIEKTPNVYLALRHDEEAGMSQILHAIIRAGSQGYGIVTAHGKNVPDGTQPYIAQLGTDTRLQGRAKFITPLSAGQRVPFGGSSGLAPELRLERQSFQLTLIGREKMRIEGRQRRCNTYQFITANSIATDDDGYDPLREDVRTWSLPPGFLAYALRKPTKPKNTKRSFLKAQQQRLVTV